MTLLEENGKADEALKGYAALIEKAEHNPVSITPRYYLAVLLAANGDDEGAMKAIGDAGQYLLWNSGRNIDQGVQDGLLYLPRTLEVLAACVKLAPQNGPVKCRVVETYIAYGHPDKAFAYLCDNSEMITKADLFDYAVYMCMVGAEGKAAKDLAYQVLSYEEERAAKKRQVWPLVLRLARLRAHVLKTLLNAKDYAALADKADAELKQLEDDREKMKNLRADEEKRERDAAASSPGPRCGTDEYNRLLMYLGSNFTMMGLKVEALGCGAIAAVELGKKDGACDQLLGSLADIQKVPGFDEDKGLRQQLKLKCYSYLVTVAEKLGQKDKADEFRKEAETLKNKK
jgi:hypothetical protein